jgi:hypothetical protein
MNSKNTLSVIAAFILAIGSMIATAGEVAAQQAPKSDVVPLAGSSQLLSLLPDSLAGVRATSELKQVANENLGELVGDKAQIYREYRVTSAASREYGGARVDIFETRHQLAAFGLLTFSLGVDSKRPIEEDIGSGTLRLADALVFFKGRFLIRIGNTAHNGARGNRSGYEALAQAIAAEIVPANTAITRAALLDSLPGASIVSGSRRYLLGPESLNTYIEHGRDLFDFNGDTEAAAAEYKQGPDAQVTAQAVDQKSTRPGPSAPAITGSSPDVLKLAIVEYHTPQFATDALTRATDYLSSLPEDQQQRIIIKRVGNYVVEAANVRDRSFAEGLIDSVEYPYAVKWLRNPLWPTNDPFRAQKAAQMLLSTFGLLGLILMTVLVVGTVFGTTIFLKRRKRQQQVFSDAGGMLRLDIDQFESAMVLGLPPARNDER